MGSFGCFAPLGAQYAFAAPAISPLWGSIRLRCRAFSPSGNTRGLPAYLRGANTAGAAVGKADAPRFFVRHPIACRRTPGV